MNIKPYRAYLGTALAVIAAMAVFSGEALSAEKDKKLEIGRMKVTLMPEYESPGVLVIQEGKFTDLTAFPAYVRFNLPMKVTKLTDTCSLSPGGQHFCQLYDIKTEGGKKFVNIGLPYSGFFVDYKYAPFSVKANSKREFAYTIEVPYHIHTLEVHIQEPYRSSDFAISPTGGEQYEKNDFKYLKYVYKNVKPGEQKNFKIAYFKVDAKPSVDIKYTGMAQTGVFQNNMGEILLAGGLIILGAIIYLRNRFSKAGKPE